MTIEVFAPAKVNLTLHVTGQRSDGYHLLDSLVVFAGVGDRVRVAGSDDLSLALLGPESHGLVADDGNLVLRAARSFGVDRGAAIQLDKHLPVASGIGGGSADAAATLKALARLWQCPIPAGSDILRLGADVPVCLAGQTIRMRGIGERLDTVGALPEGLALLLVNPRVAVPTHSIFHRLERRDHPPMPKDIPDFSDATGFADWLLGQRNDLEGPAIAAAPAIARVRRAVAETGALVSRMSGSGATVFGLFATPAAAAEAAGHLRAAYPEWWVADAPIITARAA